MKTLVCEGCGEDMATDRCPECGGAFCTTCYESHGCAEPIEDEEDSVQ